MMWSHANEEDGMTGHIPEKLQKYFGFCNQTIKDKTRVTETQKERRERKKQ